MARDRTGSIETFRRADGSTYYRARIRLEDGTRERVDVPEKYSGTAESRELYALAVQEREDETGELMAKKRARLAAAAAQRNPANGETCSAYRERLEAHRKELGRGTGRHDASTWRTWIAEPLGAIPIAKVTREDIERFRDMLDEQITTHKRTGGAEGLGPKTALNVWSVVTTTFKAAENSKRRDLRVRDDNPCKGVLPPERGESRRRPFVYPSELLAVVGCLGVPLEWREAFAVGAYLYLRPGELRALTWGDVDLAGGVAHVSKAFDEDLDEVKAPKTANGVRDVPIPPTLAPLLERMGEGRAGADLVVPVVGRTHQSNRALRFVRSLRVAGVTRPRLFESTPTTMPVNFRSLRDSGITWLALAGVDVMKIQRRAGHDSVSTTIGYVKQAEDLGGVAGEPFGALPSTLVEGVRGEDDEAPKLAAPPTRWAKQWAKLAPHIAKTLENKAETVRRGGLEAPRNAQVAVTADGSRAEIPPRADASARTLAGNGPSCEPLGQSTTTPAATLREELAALVARAMREGDLDTAAKLLEVAKTATRAPAADVIELADERAKRR